MSIPRYLLKRMVAKDAVKLIDNNIVIKVVNLVSPATIDEIPPQEELKKMIKVLVDGEVVIDENTPNILNEILIKYGPNGNETAYSLGDLHKGVGDLIAQGDNLIFSYPNKTVIL